MLTLAKPLGGGLPIGAVLLAEAHAGGTLDPSKLPAPIERALIAHGGALRARFEHLSEFLD